MKRTAVILAGGAGTRLYPLSSEEKPKQFLALFEGKSLLQKTFARLKRLVDRDGIYVSTNERYRQQCIDQLPEVLPENIITEPARPVSEFRRNVPANVVAAIARALEKLPADRFDSAKAFSEALANSGFSHATSVGAGRTPRCPSWIRHSVAESNLTHRRAATATGPASMLRDRRWQSRQQLPECRFRSTPA